MSVQALQKQPSRTSCGPTCVAMIADVPVEQVLEMLPKVRTPSRASRFKNHRSNVGEVRRLLDHFAGADLGPRTRGPLPRRGQWLVRIEHPTGGGWHFAVLERGWIYDPSGHDHAYPAEHLEQHVSANRLSVYEVQ